MISDQYKINNPQAFAAEFLGIIVGVIQFDNLFEIIGSTDQIFLERYVIDSNHEIDIIDSLLTMTTGKYPNLGGSIGPINPEDGFYSVTTSTFMSDFSHLSDLNIEAIPSIWSIRSMILDGSNEILDPEIDLTYTYMYRLTWIINGKGYSTNYFLLIADDDLPNLEDTEDEDFTKDDGGTIRIGVDGNPTDQDLGYGNGPGDPFIVDQLLEQDSWLDYCFVSNPNVTINDAPGFKDYFEQKTNYSYKCFPHLLNRLNFRYRGTIENIKINSYEVQIRNILDVALDSISTNMRSTNQMSETLNNLS